MIPRLLKHLLPADASRPERQADAGAVIARGGTIAGLRVDAIRPLRDGAAANKDGQLACAGTIDGSAVKIYEARSEAHARFIEAVSGHPAVGDFFPRVLGVDGVLVVAEWINGELAAWQPDDVVAVQHRLHQLAAADLPAPGFDYWHDYLEPRFIRAARTLGRSEVIDLVTASVRRAWNRSERVLMNPDMTPVNLIVDGQRRLKIVDAGDLTTGALPWLDVLNTAHALAEGQRQEYLTRCAGLTTGSVPARDFEVLNAAWLARLVGSACVAGRFNEADRAIDAFLGGRSVLPHSSDLAAITAARSRV